MRTTVLYIQPVAERGGSDQALVRMIRTLPRSSFACHVVVPAPSPMRAELEGAGATVSIEESPAGLRRLRTNNNFTEGGDAASISQIRQGMMGTLFARDARRVLALGVGSGITLAGAVAGLPEARFDAVELIPEIRGAVGAFFIR